MSEKSKKAVDLAKAHAFISVRNLSKMTGLGKSQVHRQLKKCGLKNRWNQWKPHELTTAQLQKRVKIAETAFS